MEAGELRALVHEDSDFRHSQNRGIALRPPRHALDEAWHYSIEPGDEDGDGSPDDPSSEKGRQYEGILVRYLRELPSLNRYSSAGV